MQTIMGVESFLASYPLITDQESFYQRIFQKKEFYDLKLTSTPPPQPEDGHAYNHQKLVARFLSSHTLYDELILFHSPGTGKTMSAIHTIEQLLQTPGSSYKRAVVIVPNETLMGRFTQEIVFTGSKGRYYPEPEEEDAFLSEEQLREKRFAYAKKRMQGSYWITTHERFYAVLNKLPRAKWESDFSNTILVVDEAHRVANNTTWYTTYHDLFHVTRNRKILLMTGTPMRNQASEIALLLNLILPAPLPVGPAFNERFFREDGTLQPDMTLLTDALTGRVSYLKLKVSIPQTFQGVRVSGLTYPVVPSSMGAHQSQTYVACYRSDTEESFYRNSLQASLFVFPDGSYGTKGFSTYVQQRGNRFVGKFLQRVTGSYDEKLAKLSTFSSKYPAVLSSIVNARDKNTFVYTSSIKGGGAILFGLCLELFGYQRANRKDDLATPGKRYAVLSESVGTDIPSILQEFNRKRNSEGKYLQVLIGGKQVEEGVTFYSIQQIHVLTPTWNFSSLDQAIARGIRMRAHRFLPPLTNVDIFLHVAVPPSPTESVDLQLYTSSQVKDTQIKQMEYMIKTHAWDCALTYDRNRVTSSADGDRECEYQPCRYRCAGVPEPYVLDESSLDKSTYQLFYQDDYRETLVQLLTRIFRKQFVVTIWEILHILDNRYTSFQVFQALQSIRQSSFVFTNRFGFKSYMHESNNVYFLSETIYETNLLSSFYSEHPVLSHTDDFLTRVDEMLFSEESMVREIQALTNLPFELKVRGIPTLPPIAQEAFIENAVSAEADGIRTHLTDWVLAYYDNYLIEYQRNPASTFLGDNVLRIFMYDRVWMTRVVDQTTSERLNQLLFSEHGIYGRLRGDVFVITNMSTIPMDRRKRESMTRGKVCTSHTITELSDLVQLLQVPVSADPKQRTKAKLCRVLYEFFDSHDMLVQ